MDANHECIEKAGKAASLARMFNKQSGRGGGDMAGNVREKCWERMVEEDEEEKSDSVGVTRKREGGRLNFLTGFDDKI